MTIPVEPTNITRKVETNCPICNSNIGFRNYIQWEEHQWVSCRHCGGGHKEPYTPECEDTTIVERYDQEYFESEFFERRRRFAVNQANWLKRNYEDGMTVVEVGPGLGLAAEEFLKLVPGTSYHVVEPHATFADFLKNRLGNTITLHSGDAENALDHALKLASAEDKAILLYMDNVLEHVAYPRKLIEKLLTKLPVGSKALFDVPNERGLKYRARIYTAIGGQATVAAGHINLFSVKAFSCMLSSLEVQRYKVKQRGIRRREEVNCLPEGPVLDLTLALLRIFPADTILGLGNNLRVVVEF